jgi:DNA-binding NtrC family response regulator
MANKIKLLLVDDEERLLKTLKQRLELRDFEVTAVTRGADALAEAEARPFDLALVDLKMPGMNGEEVLERLKAKDRFIEVVILTGHGSIDSAVRSTKLGSHAYLQKPCATEELLEVLKDAYSKRVKRKLEIQQRELEERLGQAMGESPLAILRRLRELEDQD